MSLGEPAGPATPVAGLLLAAGRGTRFDPSGRQDKLLQPIDGVPVVVCAARHLAEATGRVFAVVRSLDAPVARVLAAEGCELIECPRAIDGMGHSLAAGIARIAREPDWRAAAVALGDMPHVRPGTIRTLCSRLADRHTIAVPVHAARDGHPVVFGREHFDALAMLTGDRGARLLLDGAHVSRVAVDDPGVLHDVDTPADLTTHPSARSADDAFHESPRG